MNHVFIFDSEVFAHDWLFVFKEVATGSYTVIHNDNEAMIEFMQRKPLLGGFNNKHYDNHILKAILSDADPQQVKRVNDMIIKEGLNGWPIPCLQECSIRFDSFDLMDDCQVGQSLKSIEGHLGMNIQETEVDFEVDRKLTDEELKQTEVYCKHDVDATEKLYELRQAYLNNKITLGKLAGLPAAKALGMTNAKLTAAMLKAKLQPHNDERQYMYPSNLKREYIPQEVFDFFDRMHDEKLSDEEVFGQKLDFSIGRSAVTVGFGGVHSSINHFFWKEGD